MIDWIQKDVLMRVARQYGLKEPKAVMKVDGEKKKGPPKIVDLLTYDKDPLSVN